MPFPVLDISALPIRTDRTLRAVPYVTYVLLFTNLIIYLVNLRLSFFQVNQLELHWGFIIGKPSLLTLFTYAFLHDDLLHLLGNMLILWLVGTVLETGIGSITFLLLYFASSVTGILLYGLIARAFMPGSLMLPLIGASGAISGLLGLAAIRFYRLRVLTFPMIALSWLPVPVPLPIPIWVPLWAYAVWFAAREVVAGVMNITTRETSTVAHWAHIGGLALGVLAAVLMQVVQEGKRESVLEDSMRASSGATPQDRARRDVQRLLREKPNDPEALEAMAALTLVNGERERSRELYLQAIPLFLAAGLRDRAATCYLNVLRVFPQTVLAMREQMAVATALEAMRHFTEAVQAFGLMAEHYPEVEEAQTSLLRAAQLHQRYLQNPAEALRILHDFLRTYPNSPWSGLVHERLEVLEKETAIARSQISAPQDEKMG